MPGMYWKWFSARNPAPRNVEEVKLALLGEWENLLQELLENHLILSIDRCVPALKRAHGRTTVINVVNLFDNLNYI